ncbi:hypothetical protein pb186bvf_005630 [Paramecium bursaria]
MFLYFLMKFIPQQIHNKQVIKELLKQQSFTITQIYCQNLSINNSLINSLEILQLSFHSNCSLLILLLKFILRLNQDFFFANPKYNDNYSIIPKNYYNFLYNIQMGPIVSYNKTFVFDEPKYNYVVTESCKMKEKINIDLLQSSYHCMMMNHAEEKVYTICTNIHCQSQSRRVCFFCVRDELHKKDQNFMMSHFRSDIEISKIIKCFIQVIQNEIDSLEFDILIKKLEFCDKKNSKNILRMIKKLKEIYSDFKNYKLQVSNLNKKTYYEKLDIQQNLSLLEFLREESFFLVVLQNRFFNTAYNFKGLNAKSNDNYINQQDIMGANADKWIKKQQILIDLHKSNINLNQIKRYKQKLMNSNVRNIIEIELYNIINYARQQIKNKDYDFAREICVQMVDQINISDSKYQIIIQMQIEICKLTKQFEEAVRIINLNLDRIPKIEFMYQKAQLLERCNQYDEALVTYDKIITLNPNNTDYLFLKGRINLIFSKAQLLEKCDKVVAALFVYDQIIQINANNTYYKYLKAELLQRCKRFNEAILVYNEIIMLKPQNTDYKFEKGQKFNFYFKAKLLKKCFKFDEALLIYDEILNLKPNDTFFLQQKGMNTSLYSAQILDDCGQFEQSLQIYDQIIQLNPQNNIYKIQKAKFLNSYYQFDEALQIYDKIDQLNQKEIRLVDEAFLLYDMKIKDQLNDTEWKFKKGQKINIIAEFFKKLLIHTTVVTNTTKVRNIKNMQAEFLLRCNRFEEALLIYDEIIQQNPNDYYYKIKKVEFYESCNNYDQALISYDEIIQQNPDNIDCKYKKADLLYKCHKLDEALQIYDQIILSNENNFDYIINKAEFLLRLNKLEHATEVISQIILMKSNNKLDKFDFQQKFDQLIVKWSDQNQFRINNSENLDIEIKR